MKPITLLEIIQWTRGRLVSGSGGGRINGVSTDSRTICPGDLFIPLIGERFDGHDYLDDAVASGAAAALVESTRLHQYRTGAEAPRGESREFSLIAVENTLSALQGLAHNYRLQFDLPLIAVTGSTGKTTTKDIVAGVLAQGGSVLKSQENLNNEIGLPLTLLRLDEGQSYGVVEMGMRGRGQIAALTHIAQPQVGVITNIGVVHLELLGTVAQIAAAKEELLQTMAPGTTAVLNADDEAVRAMGARCRDLEVIYYGYRKPRWLLPADARYMTATDIVGQGAAGTTCTLHFGPQQAAAAWPWPGRYQVHNALAAAAACAAVGFDLQQIATGLAGGRLSSMRMERIPLAGGGLLLNDAYNANPTSMGAALETAGDLASGRPLIFILGDMLELGCLSPRAHYEVGKQVAIFQPRLLITVGPESTQLVQGAIDGGLEAARIVECSDYRAARDTALQRVQPEDVVLVKGSRGIALEHVVWALAENCT